MSNLELARRIFDTFNAGGYIADPRSIWRTDPNEALARIYDPECELRPAGADASQVYRGYEGVRAYLFDLTEAWGQMRLEPHTFTEFGDSVVVEYTNHAVGRESGAVVDQTFWLVITVRDGRVLATRNFNDREAAIEAARDAN